MEAAASAQVGDASKGGKKSESAEAAAFAHMGSASNGSKKSMEAAASVQTKGQA